MYKFLTKNGQTISFVLGAVLVILFYVLVVVDKNYDTFTAMDMDGIKDPERYNFGLFNFGLAITGVLIVVGAVLMVGFGFFQAVTNIKSSLGAIVGLGAIIIIFAIGYSTTQIETSGQVYDAAMKFELTDNVRKIIGGSITTSAALITIATLGIVLSEIRNFFK